MLRGIIPWSCGRKDGPPMCHPVDGTSGSYLGMGGGGGGGGGAGRRGHKSLTRDVVKRAGRHRLGGHAVSCRDAAELLHNLNALVGDEGRDGIVDLSPQGHDLVRAALHYLKNLVGGLRGRIAHTASLRSSHKRLQAT